MITHQLRSETTTWSLHDLDPVLDAYAGVLRDLDVAIDRYVGQDSVPHLCHRGCSLCCKTGAFFKLGLVEAVYLQRGLAAYDATRRATVRERNAVISDRAEAVRREQFPGGIHSPEEFTQFVSGVTKLREQVPCSLLFDDVCSVYAHRPLLCRLYGLASDVYMYRIDDATVFSTFCRLYEGYAIDSYARLTTYRDHIEALSRALAGGADPPLFTIADAISLTIRPHSRSPEAGQAE